MVGDVGGRRDRERHALADGRSEAVGANPSAPLACPDASSAEMAACADGKQNASHAFAPYGDLEGSAHVGLSRPIVSAKRRMPSIASLERLPGREHEPGNASSSPACYIVLE